MKETLPLPPSPMLLLLLLLLLYGCTVLCCWSSRSTAPQINCSPWPLLPTHLLLQAWLGHTMGSVNL
jgi:hypothetical protein